MDLLKVPAHAIRVGVRDSLKVTFWGKTAGVDLYVRAQIMDDNGIVVPVTEFIATPASLGSTASKNIRLSEGWLMSVSAVLDAVELPGAGWAIVELVRDETALSQASINLVSGQPSSFRSISWPGVPPINSVDGAWQPGQLEVANPGAGLDLTYTLLTYEMFHCKAIYFQFVTDANVANRTIRIYYDFGSTASEVVAAMASIVQTAGVTLNYAFYVGGPTDKVITLTGTDLYTGVLADIPLPGGSRLRIDTEGNQVGDVLSNINLLGLRKVWT